MVYHRSTRIKVPKDNNASSFLSAHSSSLPRIGKIQCYRSGNSTKRQPLAIQVLEIHVAQGLAPAVTRCRYASGPETRSSGVRRDIGCTKQQRPESLTFKGTEKRCMCMSRHRSSQTFWSGKNRRGCRLGEGYGFREADTG